MGELGAWVRGMALARDHGGQYMGTAFLRSGGSGMLGVRRPHNSWGLSHLPKVGRAPDEIGSVRPLTLMPWSRAVIGILAQRPNCGHCAYLGGPRMARIGDWWCR